MGSIERNIVSSIESSKLSSIESSIMGSIESDSVNDTLSSTVGAGYSGHHSEQYDSSSVNSTVKDIVNSMRVFSE